MAVTKRTRFEVLRRDNYTCRYCRSVENELTVDHVTPVALGGSDDPSNLVAACKDCNAGKSSSSPDAPTVAQVKDDAVRWAQARAEVIKEMRAGRDKYVKPLEVFGDYWSCYDKDRSYLPNDWRTTVIGWMQQGITAQQLCDAVDIAMGNRSIRFEYVFRYVGGIVRNWLAKIDEQVQARLADEPTDETDEASDEDVWALLDATFRDPLLELVIDGFQNVAIFKKNLPLVPVAA